MAHHSKPGIGHTPTLQSGAVAGQKRPYDSSISHSSDRNGAASQKRPTPRHHAPNALNGRPTGELPRLTASRIEYADGSVTRASPSEYSQRQVFAATPTSTVDPLLSLSHPAYGLPRQLVANFAALGIKAIYPWQKQCLLGPGLLQGDKNLVYSAPTGGGKSLVADVLMLKRVLQDRDAKALLVLPYVALVQEKVRWLRNIVSGISRDELGPRPHENQPRLWARRADKDTVRVVGFFGGSKVRATWADFDIAVCTIEKVSSP